MRSIIITLVLVLLCSLNEAVFAKSLLKGKPVVQGLINAVFGPNSLGYPCRQLRSAPQQQKSCYRNPKIRELFLKAAEVAKNHCQEQFRFNPWGCSSLYGNTTFVKQTTMYRETAVFYAMYSAAVVQTVSRACADGRLKRCKCDKGTEQGALSTWKWGICGDDFAEGRRFTRKFLQLSEAGMDYLGNLVRHNSEIGIQAVADNMNHICKCHGVSGSCTMRTCWSRLREFTGVAQQMKKYYHSAVLQQPDNNVRSKKLSATSDKQLYYLERSPSFCSNTHGRYCQNPANCATMCCGRGYVHSRMPVPHYCNCHWKPNPVNLTCSVCSSMQEIYICK